MRSASPTGLQRRPDAAPRADRRLFISNGAPMRPQTAPHTLGATLPAPAGLPHRSGIGYIQWINTKTPLQPPTNSDQQPGAVCGGMPSAPSVLRGAWSSHPTLWKL